SENLDSGDLDCRVRAPHKIDGPHDTAGKLFSDRGKILEAPRLQMSHRRRNEPCRNVQSPDRSGPRQIALLPATLVSACSLNIGIEVKLRTDIRGPSKMIGNGDPSI